MTLIETPLFWGDFFTDRWREFTIPLPVSANLPTESLDYDADEVEDHHYGGGIALKNGHRSLYWRVRGVVLELIEISLDITLSGNALRFRFPAPVLSNVTGVQHGARAFCILAATEVGTIHRLVFNVESTAESVSILDSFSYSILQNPGHHIVLPSSRYGSFTCTKAIDSHQIVLGTTEGSVVVASMCAVESAQTATNDPVSVTVLRPHGTVQRLLGAFLTPFKRRGTEVIVTSLDIFVCGEAGDVFIVALCADNVVRIWSISSGSLTLTMPIVWDGIQVENDDVDEIKPDLNVFMRVVPCDMTFALILSVHQEGHSQLQVHRATLPFGSLTLGGGEGCVTMELDRIIGGSPGHVIDLQWYCDRLWSLWKDSEGCVGLSGYLLPLTIDEDAAENDMPMPEWRVRVIDDDAMEWLDEFTAGVPHNLDPEDYHVTRLFAAHRFPVSVIRKALGQAFGHSCLPRSSTLAALRSAACKATRADAVQTLNHTVPPLDPLGYHDALTRAWNKFATHMFECWSSEAEAIGIVCDGSVGIIRIGGVSLVRGASSKAEEADVMLRTGERLDGNVMGVARELANAMGPAALQSISDQLDDVVDPLEAVLASIAVPISPSTSERIRRHITSLPSVVESLDAALHTIDDFVDAPLMPAWSTSPVAFGSGSAACIAAFGAAQTILSRYAIIRDLTLLCVYLVQARRSARITPKDVAKLTEILGPMCASLIITAHTDVALYTSPDAIIGLEPSSVASMATRPSEGHECGTTLFSLQSLSSQPSAVHPGTSVLAQGLHTLSISRHALPRTPHRKQTTTPLLREAALLHIGAAAHAPRLNEAATRAHLGAFSQIAAGVSAAVNNLTMTNVGVIAFLSRLGLHGQVQAVTRLLGPRKPMACHFLAEAFLATGEANKALSCYLEAAASIATDDSLRAMISGTVEEESEDSNDLDLLTVRYYIHAMQMLEQRLEPQLVIKCAQAALGHCNTDALMKQKRALWTSLFQHHLVLGHYDDAFLAASSIPDPTLRRDAAARLVSVMCDEKQYHRLCTSAFGDLDDTVDAALADKARKTPLEAGGRAAYMVMYSWHVYRGSFRQAADAMLELARVEDVASRRVTALSIAASALQLVKEDSAWLLRKINADVAAPMVIEPTEDDRFGPLTLSAVAGGPGPQQRGDVPLPLPDASRVLLSLAPQPQAQQQMPMEVIDINALHRALVLALAQSELGPSPTMEAADVLALLLERGAFDRAADLCDAFILDGSRRRTVEAMGVSCAKRQLNGEASLWSELKALLGRWSSDGHLCVHSAAAVLGVDESMALPKWLASMCEVRDAGALLRTYYKYDRSEAIGVAIRSIRKAMDSLSEPRTSQCLPWSAIDAVLAKWSSESLRDVVDEYLDKVELVKRVVA